MSRRRARISLLFLACAVTAEAFTVPVGRNFRVNSTVDGTQGLPAVAIDGAGNHVVVWAEGGTVGGVRGQRYDPTGAPLGGEFTVSTSLAGYPAVAAGPGGGFLVVWAAAADVRALRYDAAGTPQGSAFVVNAYTTGTQGNPAVAADGLGNFIVAWEGPVAHDPMSGIAARRFDAAGAALGGDIAVSAYTTDTQSSPSVAADGSGNFVVAWTSRTDGDGASVAGRRFDAGGTPLGGEFVVNTYTTSFQFEPSVAQRSAGDFVVVWTDQDGIIPNARAIVAQRFDASGTAVGGEIQVGAAPFLADTRARAAMDSGGDFMIVWQRGTPFGARRYESDGTPQGADFDVSDYTLFDRDQATVAAGGAGRFLVVWHDEIGDDVVAQRFSAGCGDGIVEPGEACDDGNAAAGDGCAAKCVAETCSACVGSPSSCGPIVTCTAGDGCCAPGCTAATDADCPTPIAGAMLAIRDPLSSATVKSTLGFKSTDAGIDTSLASGFDPLADGAAIQIYKPTGEEDPRCWEFPAASWTFRDTTNGGRVFKYRDTEAVPCRIARVRGGRLLRAQCAGVVSRVPYRLGPSPQGSLAVRFKSGGIDYCTLFDSASIQRDTDVSFLARGAPAPASCPEPPVPCPFRIAPAE